MGTTVTGVNKGGLRILIIAVLVLVGGFAVKHFVLDAPKSVTKSGVTGKILLPDEPSASLSGEKAVKLEAPSTKTFTASDAVKVENKIMAWNAQMSWMFANGGVTTTVGSLMSKANVQLTLTRQDDCNKSCADLVAFAKAYKADPNTPGVMVTFMGDGMPGFEAALYPELGNLGADYEPIVVGGLISGASYGEDQLLAPASWRENPRNAIGKTVACVIRDGDMNILLKWAFDNNIPVNPDEKTYDSSAINLMAADDFLKSAEKYITGYTEERTVVVNGKTTKGKKTVGADAVASWTPADVNISEAKGDLVSIVSTKEYSTQMGAVVVTIKKWAHDHNDAVKGMIVALSEAGDQVRSYESAKSFAADISAKVYNEKNGAYWLKYYNGVDGATANNSRLDKDSHLGGSRSFNLMDNANYVGEGDDHIDRYKSVYNTFSSILFKMYPKEMAGFPDYSKVLDRSFLSQVIGEHPELLEGKALEVNYATTTTHTISSKAYQIQFDNGSAVIKESSKADLQSMFDAAMSAENLNINLSGHTDTKGDPTSNLALSQRRADAVKAYLVGKKIKSKRISSVGLGNQLPVNCTDTRNGDNENRRVVVFTLAE